MLNAIIQFALRQRALVLCAALATLVLGTMTINSLPIDVLPDLTRPRVSIITECPGMAPEEVERQVTIPLESAVNGAPGVQDVRSSSDVGLSVINVEFDWDSEIYRARQIVDERISQVTELPKDVHPKLGPVSSLLGQIMIVGMWSENGDTNPIELRTDADWIVKKRLEKIPGISQVITMGGGRKQFHVLIDIHQLHKYEVTLSDVTSALQASNLNVNGGYLDQNAKEMLVRGVGRMENPEDLKKIVVRSDAKRSVLLGNVATITIAPQPKRGDSSVNGIPAVVLTIQKQPKADTRELTDLINSALVELRPSLPADVRIEATYEQRTFIDHSIQNVVDALRDGSILVIIILFIFLFNLRTTMITLTAIPVSIVVTAIVFRWFDLSINVMTLGGIAIALGELVDDAIVDVENIFRRLKQNAKRENPQPILRVIFNASVEVRNAIIISTILVVVVFLPLFALSGIEGRMFVPLGVAYIVSILASTVVSLTLTPVLSYYLLSSTGKDKSKADDGPFVKLMKWIIRPFVEISLDKIALVSILGLFLMVSVGSGYYVWQMGKDFLPDFDEGSMQLNLIAFPGTSLSSSGEISKVADKELQKLVRTPGNPDGPIRYFTCRTGRAENDEHVMGVNISEYVISVYPDSRLTVDDLEYIEKAIPYVETETEQPIAHLISHMISGVTAQIAIKLFGDDLDQLLRKGTEIKNAISDIEGIAPPILEQQQVIPQLRIEPDYDALAKYRLQANSVFDMVEIAMQGKVVSTLVQDERFFDIVVRFPEEYRGNMEQLNRIPIEVPGGGVIPLSSIARIYEYGGPNTIKRDDARRRIVVRVNTKDRDLESVVNEIQERIKTQVELPQGYYVQLGGQFQAQQSAGQRILILSAVAIVVVFFVLFSAYNSTSIVIQILSALPVAFVGGVAALWLTDQSLTVAAMVGFISLGGIAARNGLLLVSTYLDMADEEGGLTRDIIVRGSLERMTPVLMTTMTTGIALLPLILAGNLPGREILFPVATVIVGGLITSTLCEFLIRPGMFYYFTGKLPSRENTTRI